MATVQVVRGQVDVGMALETVGTGARWRVIGIGLMSAEGFSQGLRSLILQPLDRIQEGKELLNEGDRLLAVI